MPAANRWPSADGVVAPKKPMVGSLVACCARARLTLTAVPRRSARHDPALASRRVSGLLALEISRSARKA